MSNFKKKCLSEFTRKCEFYENIREKWPTVNTLALTQLAHMASATIFYQKMADVFSNFRLKLLKAADIAGVPFDNNESLFSSVGNFSSTKHDRLRYYNLLVFHR